VPDKNVSKYVFYHGQDFDSLKETGQCFLCWDGDAKFICETLKEVGLKVDHDGSPGSRIMISMPNSVMN
jgi:hypothetical protein